MQINSYSSYTSLTSLNQAISAYQKSMQSLSSGKSINSSADNPAAFVILQGMQAQTSGLNQAYDNTQNSISLLNTAAGAMTDSTNELQDMQTLDVQAANGALNDADRAAIQDEMNQLGAQVDANANTTQFNGINTNDGTLTNFITQTGANSGQVEVTSIPSSSVEALGVNDDVSTQAAAEANMGTIATGIQNITSIEANVGAVTNDLEYSGDNTLQSASNTQAAASTIGDTNMALQSNQFIQSSIQQYVAIMMQAQQMNQSQGILSLIA